MKNEFANDIKKIVSRYIYYKYIYLSLDSYTLLNLIKSEYEPGSSHTYTNYERFGEIFENIYLPAILYYHNKNDKDKTQNLINLINNNFLNEKGILKFVIDWEDIFTFYFKSKNIEIMDYLSSDLRKSIVNTIKYRSTGIILDFEKEILLKYDK